MHTLKLTSTFVIYVLAFSANAKINLLDTYIGKICEIDDQLSTEQAIERVEWAFNCGVLGESYRSDPPQIRDVFLHGADQVQQIISYPVFIKIENGLHVWKAPTDRKAKCQFKQGYTNQATCMHFVTDSCAAKRYWALKRKIIDYDEYRMMVENDEVPELIRENEGEYEVYRNLAPVPCE